MLGVDSRAEILFVLRPVIRQESLVDEKHQFFFGLVWSTVYQGNKGLGQFGQSVVASTLRAQALQLRGFVQGYRAKCRIDEHDDGIKS